MSRERARAGQAAGGLPGRKSPDKPVAGAAQACISSRSFAPVAQLDRASDYGSEGWEFDSLRVQTFPQLLNRIHMQHLSKCVCALFFAASAAVLTGCGPKEPDYQKVLQENERLRAELAKGGKETAPSGKKAGAIVAVPDLDVDINTLWTQRFDDNEFRSRQRLSGKTIRVTGAVDSVSDGSLSLLGNSKRFGSVRMTVNFTPVYAARSRKGLASLERGLPVTVQGSFIYERTCLSDAVIVDRKSGRELSSDEIAESARERAVEAGEAEP